MEAFLRCFVTACPKKWLDWLLLAEFWYNTSHHSSIGQSPFLALYGHSPRHFGVFPDAATPVLSLNEWLQEWQLMTALIKHHLNRAVVRMKNEAYKKRSEQQFDKGDLVLLKLKPYVQSLLEPRANQKLSFKYFGPFEILDRVGAVAYKLKLPEQCVVHPVLHVSQLKRVVGVSVPITAELPSDLTAWQLPEMVLQKRLTNHNIRPVLQGLIKWSAYRVRNQVDRYLV
jgi:hypothetical protein